MQQNEFNQWSKNAHNKAIQVANDPILIEKYKNLFREKL
jgi:hypothetical protein